MILDRVFKTLSQWSRGVSPSHIFRQPYRTTKEYNQEQLVNRVTNWTFTCAGKNAQAVAQTPLRLYAVRAQGQARARSRSGRPARPLGQDELFGLKATHPRLKADPRVTSAVEVEEIIDHPFLDLIAHVNEFRDWYAFMEESQLYSDITGNTYWQVDYNDLGMPESMYLLPSQWVSIVPHRTRFIDYYAYGRNGTDRQTLSTDEVVHVRMPNLRDQYYGMGCLEA